MSSALVVAKRKVVEFTALFYPRQPVFDDAGNTALQYRSPSFLFHPGGRFASKHLFADELGESADFEWFHHDFVRFQKDSVHGALHVGVAADEQCKCMWLGVAHRRNHRKTITGV